jgi:nitrite reductase/ring-hydroxylating ferredoxin subunit
MARQLCSIGEISEQGTEVWITEGVARRYLMLFRRGATVLGYHNVCPHQGRSLNFAPDRFHFTPEGWLMCAHHGACFDLDSGRCVDGPCEGAGLRPLKLEIRDGEVWLAEAPE